MTRTIAVHRCPQTRVGREIFQGKQGCSETQCVFGVTYAAELVIPLQGYISLISKKCQQWHALTGFAGCPPIKPIMGAPFSGCGSLQAAVREAARALAAAIAHEMRGAGGALPVAKAVPLVSNAADALLAPGPRRGALLAALAALPATERLCATVYSCGPPL